MIRNFSRIKNRRIIAPCQVFSVIYYHCKTSSNNSSVKAFKSQQKHQQATMNCEHTNADVTLTESGISSTLQKLEIRNNTEDDSVLPIDGQKSDNTLVEKEEEYQFFNDDQDACNQLKQQNSPSSLMENRKKTNEENVQMWNKLMEQTSHAKKPYPEIKIVRNRPLSDATEVFRHNNWDNIEWDTEMQDKAKEAIFKNTQTKMDEDQKSILEANANEYWNKFYENHQNKFFKNRNWLFQEFPELEGPFGCSVTQEEYDKGIQEKRSNESYPGENSGFRVLELGCGVGNTVIPLLSGNNNPESFLYCCDFSKTAVEIVKNHEHLDTNRCTPFVLDITTDNPITPFPPESVDVVILIFVLSAINPEKFKNAIRNVHTFLKPGGMVLFRDYGRYDLAQLRFKNGKCIQDNFYMRGDGTRVFFFTLDEVEELFCKNGFSKMHLEEDRRLQVNRSKQLKMYRIWILGKFIKNG